MGDTKKFEIINSSNAASGTSLQGYIATTYDYLVEKLGEPRRTCGDGKVTAEWILRFEDGAVATIYDWKTGKTPKSLYNWHVGGKSSKILTVVTNALKIKKIATIEDITSLTDQWYDLIGKDHHKDRDCHFYIETRWSYGYPPKYVVQHYGYILDSINEEFETYDEALQFLKETLIKEIKEYTEYQTVDNDDCGW